MEILLFGKLKEDKRFVASQCGSNELLDIVKN